MRVHLCLQLVTRDAERRAVRLLQLNVSIFTNAVDKRLTF